MCSSSGSTPESGSNGPVRSGTGGIQPTLGLLWAEAAGRLSYRTTWMYVTDGGHDHNLGLVEALRRGARHIVVLDASGDKADTWFTLGGAIALARADTGVDIDLDPTTMVRGGRGLAPGRWSAHGRMAGSTGRRKNPARARSQSCRSRARSGCASSAGGQARRGTSRPTPSKHGTYPCDSTLEQLYNASESRPTSSSAPQRSWMRSRAADRLSSGWPRQRPRLRPAAPSVLQRAPLTTARPARPRLSCGNQRTVQGGCHDCLRGHCQRAGRYRGHSRVWRCR